MGYNTNTIAQQKQANIDSLIEDGFSAHINDAGENSAAHGFHEDWPTASTWTTAEEEKVQLRRAIVEKLDLIHEEISEALGEIRSGRDPLELYFSETRKEREDGAVVAEYTTYHDEQVYVEGVPQYKPEGFLVELADAVIRTHDLVYLVDGGEQYIEADLQKREYNRSREYKHGRKF